MNTAGAVRDESATRSAIVVGNLLQTERDAVSRAMAQSDVSVVSCASIARALSKMRANHAPPVCVLACGEVDVKRLVEEVRDDAQLFGVPVIAALPRPSNDSYRSAYLSGADDALVLADVGGLTRRLANLTVNRADLRPAATLGRVVVAATGDAGRRRIGRTLRQVGFDVLYAAGVDEIEPLAKSANPPAFAVTTEPLDGIAHTLAEPGRNDIVRISGVPVLLLRADEIEAPTLAGDRLVDLTGKLLFFADEQSKAKFKDRRSSARKLYSTICAFREAGSLQPVYGVSHNLSRDGLYVRTFDPPRPQSAIWIELRTPTHDVCVHLRARVMWQRFPGSAVGVLPPGFGLQLNGALCPPGDLEAFVRGYEGLEA